MKQIINRRILWFLKIRLKNQWKIWCNKIHNSNKDLKILNKLIQIIRTCNKLIKMLSKWIKINKEINKCLQTLITIKIIMVLSQNIIIFRILMDWMVYLEMVNKIINSTQINHKWNLMRKTMGQMNKMFHPLLHSFPKNRCQNLQVHYSWEVSKYKAKKINKS